MKTIIVSYSFTGNNEALATNIATELSAPHIRIVESGHRTMLTMVLDVIFNRTPIIQPITDGIKEGDLVLFVGPVWFGQVATPLRACFSQLRNTRNMYAFISISGGAAGPNPTLEEELIKRIGKKPIAVINLYIADLLPSEPKPTMKDTSRYHLNDKDVKSLTNTVIKALRGYELH